MPKSCVFYAGIEFDKPIQDLCEIPFEINRSSGRFLLRLIKSHSRCCYAAKKLHKEKDRAKEKKIFNWPTMQRLTHDSRLKHSFLWTDDTRQKIFLWVWKSIGSRFALLPSFFPCRRFFTNVVANRNENSSRRMSSFKIAVLFLPAIYRPRNGAHFPNNDHDRRWFFLRRGIQSERKSFGKKQNWQKQTRHTRSK